MFKAINVLFLFAALSIPSYASAGIVTLGSGHNGTSKTGACEKGTVTLGSGRTGKKAKIIQTSGKADESDSKDSENEFGYYY